MIKYEIGLFIQESRTIDIEANSQSEAEEKCREMIEEKGTTGDYDMIELYDRDKTDLVSRSIEVISDADLIVHTASEELQPEYNKRISQENKELENK